MKDSLNINVITMRPNVSDLINQAITVIFSIKQSSLYNRANECDPNTYIAYNINVM